jgi:hypothetical protein
MSKELLLSIFVCACMFAGEVRITPSDPSRPATVRAHVLNGSITVTGYDGREIIAESREAIESSEESGNIISIRSPRGQGGLTIRVPRNTSLKLECTNSGQVNVDGVAGDLELSNINGPVNAAHVSGSVVAHSTNGRIVVAFDRIPPGKAMSFATLNGNVDVTFPTDLRATVSLRTDNGSIYSDFDLKLAPGTYKGSKITRASINGGGAEMAFKSVNGNIRIHRSR